MSSEGQFKPPQSGKTFVKYWEMFIEDVSQRDNFKRNHLLQLETLCELYEEMSELKADIKVNGYTFLSEGRNGMQEKIRPEVQQLNRIRAEIRAYSKMLGFLLAKDSLKTGEEEDDEWD